MKARLKAIKFTDYDGRSPFSLSPVQYRVGKVVTTSREWPMIAWAFPAEKLEELKSWAFTGYYCLLKQLADMDIQCPQAIIPRLFIIEGIPTTWPYTIMIDCVHFLNTYHHCPSSVLKDWTKNPIGQETILCCNTVKYLYFAQLKVLEEISIR